MFKTSFKLNRRSGRDLEGDPKYRLGPSANIFSIALPEGILYPEHLRLADERPFEFIAAMNAIGSVEWPDVDVLDLGCGEGTSTNWIGRTGARITGLDGRHDVLDRGRYVRDRLGYHNVDFRIGNVLDPRNWRSVHATYASGIIHHLDDPFAFIELVGRYCREMAYFCTHLAPTGEDERESSFFADSLSPLESREFRGRRYEGGRFHEGGDGREHRGSNRRSPRASIGNVYSWWPTLESFCQAMREAGFPHHRVLGSIEHRLRRRICFYREKPPSASAVPLREDGYLWEGVDRPTFEESAQRARIADSRFLSRNRLRPMVVGSGTCLAHVIAELDRSGIGVDSVYSVEKEQLNRLHRSRPAYVVLAVDRIEEIEGLYQRILMKDYCRYVFTSYALECIEKLDTPIHPVSGEAANRA